MRKSANWLAVLSGASTSFVAWAIVETLIARPRRAPGGSWEGDHYWPALSFYVLPACLSVGSWVFGFVIASGRAPRNGSADLPAAIPWWECVLLGPATLLLLYQAITLDMGLLFSPMYWSLSAISAVGACHLRMFRLWLPSVTLVAGALLHYFAASGLPHLPEGMVSKIAMILLWPISAGLGLGWTIWRKPN